MENKTSLLWSVGGKQGSEWKQANVAVGQHGNYHIGIRANTDIGSPEGHMAMDDTQFFGWVFWVYCIMIISALV